MIKKIIIFFLFISYWANAQTPSFVAQVSKNRVAVGEVFQIAFTLNGSGSNLAYPNFNDFDIYSGPNQSQSMSMVNGNISQSTTISLFIAAKKEGKFTIGPASVLSSGQKLETKPIIIEVTKAATQQQSNQNAQSGQPQQNQKQEKNQYASEISGDDLFVRTYLSKTKCYLGEQITLTQKVYSRVDLRGFQNVKFPPYNGFWSQQENSNQQINLRQENVNGVTYYVADYCTVYLFPQRTGALTIEPVELDCIVRRQTKRQPRNIFEQFFGAGGYEDVAIKVKSKPVKVDVQDLPTENKPLEFSGAVGDFGYKAELDKYQVKANEAVNLKITISGKGNIKLLEPLKLNLPESFETYDPKINENVKTNGGVSGSITYNYLIIPREKGEYTLNNLNFNYFDADKKRYVSLPSPDMKLTVLEGDPGSAQIITPTKKGVKESENDIRYIKTGNLGLKKADEEFFSSTMHYLLLILPTLLFFGALFFVRQRIKANSDIVAVKERKAAKLAKKQLTIAEKHMLSNNKDLFFSEVLNALNKYIGDKFALPIADLSKERITEMLLSKHVKDETAKQLISTLNTCEYAKYAPSAVTGDLKQVYQDTIELISKIEEQIKK
ncbi:MAG: protein BatD [Sphingobacteriaceae bacterium]|nr:protein BatD [Sphingobacteriaceae bacterium]